MCVNVLKYCASTSLRQRQMAFLLPGLLRVVVSAEKCLSPREWVKNVNAVIGCPIVTSGEVVMDGLSVQDRETVMLNKLGVIVFVKEVVSLYSVCEEADVRFTVGVIERVDG